MALFSRRRPVTSGAPSTATTFIGRKFSSSRSVTDCLENFVSAASQCYPVAAEPADVAWRLGDVAGVPSTQGGPASVPPVRFVALELVGSGPLYLAIWDGYVGHGGDGVSGQAREMWFVPPGFDGSPIPIAGTWKGLDGSLSSIGSVESAFWGA